MSKGTINKVILIGYAGRDPEVKHLDSGMSIANLSLATTETRKDRPDVTEWHRLILFGKLAEIAEKWVKKGDKLYIEGKIQTKEWVNKEGNKQRSTEIMVDSLQMLGSKNREEAGQINPQQQSLQPANNDFIDSDIPF